VLARAASVRDVQEAARNMVQNLSITPAPNEAEIDQAFAKFDRRRSDALLGVGDPFFNARRDQIVALAARYAVPAIYERHDFVAAGGLMSYGTDLADLYRQQGAYTVLVLKGSEPADLPVLQPTRFARVVNLNASTCPFRKSARASTCCSRRLRSPSARSRCSTSHPM
jgi:putative tryptophan/tyrosine transport system substrate-binding protein